METITNHIMELKGEQIGKPISEDLKNYLAPYRTDQAYAEAAVNSGVGFHTIKNVAIGRGIISEDNVAGLVELVSIAIKKCITQAKEANVTKAKLQKLLKTA